MSRDELYSRYLDLHARVIVQRGLGVAADTEIAEYFEIRHELWGY